MLALKSNQAKEAYTLALLLIIILFSSFPWSLHGMNWGDASSTFHFGNRFLQGEFPYRDYVYSTGFFPIILDALFQSILGENYFSSLVAALVIKTATLLSFYFTFRQFTSRIISTAICGGLALSTPIVNNGFSYPYVDLFLSVAILLLVLGLKSLDKKNSFIYITSAGFSLALTLETHQSSAILCIALSLGVILIYSLREPEKYLRTLAAPFSTGLILGVGTLVAFLALNNALLEGFQQLILDAGEKKNVNAISSLLDALSGGVSSKLPIKQVREYIIIPLLISIGAFLLICKSFLPSTNFKIDANTIGRLVIPLLLILGLAGQEFAKRWTKFNFDIFIYDLPRTFFSIALVGTCAFPEKSKRILGLPHPIFPILIALALAKTWAMQISWLGRWYVSTAMLFPLVMLATMMSTNVSTRWKKAISLVFLGVTGSILSHQIIKQNLVVGGNYDGLYKDAQYTMSHPMTQFIKVTEEKAVVFSTLSQNIKPGDSCFIYGSASVLYTLLQCKNPTLIDTTYVDFYTLSNAQKAVSSLKANPPQWIIETIGSRPIQDIFDGSPNFYGPFNQAGPKEMHTGLQELIKNYEPAATVKNLFPNKENLKTKDFDQILNLRLYKYKNEN